MDVDLPPPGPLTSGGLRVTALGGINEIGRNMTVFEHLGRLLIIDCGVLFPGHDEPGVDLILPDMRHVEDRLDDIEALVLTHGHEDHIGAIPFLLKLRPDIPVVGSKFTLALVAEKCREYRITPVFVEVREGQSTRHGVFECEYFAVNHSTPDALAIAVYTGAGTILHTGDIKFDQLPPDGRPTDLPGMSRLGDTGVDLLLCDSTNAEIPGVGPSESEVGPTLHRLIRGADGRVIVACFASNVDRVQQIIDAAVALGRRVSFVGRSMVRNMRVARQLGFLRVADSDLIDIAAAETMAPDQVVLITTGTQGEPMSALSRMSRGEHRSITLTAGDLIVLSSSLIPGNEEAVFGVIDALSKIGARVVTNAQARVHVSGHAYAGELLFLYNGVRPRNVMPVHGTWRMLRANAKLAASTGVPQESISVGRERCQRRPGCRQSQYLRCGAGGQDVRRRLDRRRRRRYHPGRAAHFVVGLCRGDRRGQTWHRPAVGCATSTLAGFLRRSQGARTRRAQGGGRAGIVGGRQRHRSDPDRSRGAPHGRQVGGGNLSPPADDCADGHRGVTGSLFSA